MKSAAFDEDRPELLLDDVAALSDDECLDDCRRAGEFLLFEYEL
jgi:hypothetical protein